MTISGSDLYERGLEVRFDGVPASSATFVDRTTLVCAAPPGTAGDLVDVEVQNAFGKDVLAGAFRYHQLPHVQALTVGVGSGLGGFPTRIAGNGFLIDGAGTNTVTFDGVPAPNVVVVGDTLLTCDVPAGTSGATVDVNVSNTNGSRTLVGGFTYFPAPALTSVAPAAGSSLGGLAVVLSGSGFVANAAGVNAIEFAGVPATNVVVVSDTQITCEVPAGTPGGPANVQVSNANGSGVAIAGFVYHASPVVSAVTPPSATSLGGTPLTLTGTGFLNFDAGTNAVTLAGAPATNVVVVNDTQITCDAPAGPQGTTVGLVVTNANGTGTLSAGFDYHALPTVSTVAPSSGTALGGTTVTVTGSGFVNFTPGSNAVSFGGVPATGVVVVDDTTLTCVAPAGTSGAVVDLAVANANGTATLAAGWRYHGAPTITAVAPVAGTPLGGTSVTISGSGFQVDLPGTSVVTFDGLAASNVVVVDDSTLTCTTPVGPDGAAVDVVVTNDNGTATRPSGYIYHSGPFLASVTPATGTSLGGTSVTLFGAGFVIGAAGTNTVTFDGVAATSVVTVDDNTITCLTPAGTPGASALVEVTNSNGSADLAEGYDYHSLPTVTALSPASGTSLGGTGVTVTGSGFQDFGPGSNTVTFDGVAATAVVVVNDTMLTCVTPTGSPGSAVDVAVANDNGLATLSSGYTYHALPTVGAVSPAAGTSLGGTAVTITGSGFVVDGAGTNNVTFDGAAATAVIVVDDTTITCDTPVGAAGTAVDVVVTNDNGSATLTSGYAYFATPSVVSVAPVAGTSLGGTAVTVTGTGFTANSAGTNGVTLGNAAATSVVVVDDTTLTCITPAGTPGAAVDVVVTNDNGAGTLTSSYAYFATPSVTSVAPTAGTSLGATAVTVTGTGFTANAAGTNGVSFGGAAATSVVVVDDTTITCVTPAGTPGAAVDVVVTNDNGAGVLTSGYAYFATPSVTSVSPTAGTSLGGTAVTVTGTGFTANAAGTNAVTFGGTTATNIVVVDDTTITCVIPAGPAGTSADVVVENANGTGTLSSGWSWHPEPSLSSVSPPSGTSLGGTGLTLTGSGFLANGAGPPTVTIGASTPTGITVVNDSTITCSTVAGIPGAVLDVVVSNANGTVTLTNGFTYHALPTLTAVSPGSGTSLGGASITLTGTGFQDYSPGANSVTFGGVAATGVSVTSDTSLTCLTPPGTPLDTVDVALSNANGSDTLTSAHTFHALPTLSGVSPSAGTSLGGTTVTLTGTGFQDFSPGTNGVTIGGAAATSVVVVNDTTITCSTPAGTPGATDDVVLSNTNGSDTLANAFTYHPTPTVTGVSPGSGTSLGGTAVTVTGTGFTANAAGTNGVTFDGAAATGVVVVDDTTITCVTPSGTPSATVNVVVTNDNGSGTLSSGYAYHPTPTVASVSPAAGTSLGGTAVTVTGTGFTANAAGTNGVTFDGAAATSVVVVNDTTITCTTPAGTPAGTPGAAVSVVVTNDNGSGARSAGFAYHPTPTVASASPAVGTPLGGTAVTVTGTGFTANAAGTNTVSFDGAAATSVVVVNDSTITCVTPAGSGGSTVDVVVANDNGSGTGANVWSYYASPTISSVSPSSGSSLGGKSVTLNGSGFVNNGAGANTVTIGGVTATNVVTVNDSTITCTVPPGTAGSAFDVVVSNVNGSGTLTDGFSYFAQPTVTAVSPASSPQGGGVTVTVTGSGFLANGAGTNTVAFGAAAATTVIVFSDTTLTCLVPAGSAGATVDISVTNANGTGTLFGGWLYHAEPTVSAVAPTAGSSLGGTAVTVSGTGFQANTPGTNVVTFDGAQATGVTVVNDTTLTCVTPAGTPGAAVAVAVANSNGSGALASAYTYHAAPTVTATSPAAGSALGGTSVTLTGTGFVANGAGAATVTFDGAAATGVTVVNDTTITCTTPSGTAGTSVDIVVSNANGSGTLASGYAYHPGPSLTGVVAASGRWQGGTSVTLTGTGFSDNGATAPSVTFDGVTATSIVVVNDTTITCDTPAGTPGASVDVGVANSNGTTSLSSGYAYFAQPTVTATSPSAGTSLGGTSVTVTGSGFTADAPGANAVTFGGVAATSIVAVNDTTITCVTPAGTPGAAVDVVVANANGTGTFSAGFTYHTEPALFSLSPSAGGRVGGTRVVLNGTGFSSFDAGTAVVTFGAGPATNVVVLNDTTITCDTPAGTAGTTVDVTLSNDNGSHTLISAFTYHPPPSLTMVAPTAGTSLGQTLVTLTGTGFLDNAAGINSITFGGLAATEIVVFSDTSITCESPAGTPGAAVDVELSNDNGTATLASAFTYHPLPTLASLSPTVGSSSGGETITLTGTGFTANNAGATTVTFGATAATGVTVVNDTTITCTAPAGTPGASVDVIVANTNGSATLTSGYSYYALPTLTSVSPATGTSLGGTAVTLTGTGFQANGAGSNAVTFGGLAATGVSVVNDTTITCTTPAGTPGGAVNVEVSNTNGVATLTSGWTYHSEPTLSAVSPPTGSPAGGTAVTLTGTGFQDDSPGTNAVTFGGVAATNVVVVSDTSITCDAPGGTPAATVDVVVTNDNGTATLTGSYTFYPPPTLTSIAPDHGPETGGSTVTLTGTGFQDNLPGTNTVTVGGVAATNVTVVSNTSITCDVPAGTASTSADVVLTNDNGSDTLTSAYTYNTLPTVASIAPAAGTSLGGTAVTVTGTGFQANGAGTNTVTIGGAAATSVVVVSDTSLTCLTPAGTAGTSQDVEVSNLNGPATLNAGYDYHATPTLTSVAPLFGLSDGGTSVTLTGTGLQDNAPGTNTIHFDGVPATSVVVVNDTTITCDTPSGTSGPADVFVSNANGTDTLSAGFDYNGPPVVFGIAKQWAQDGLAFAFTPTVIEPDQADTLTFSSTGTALPAWATLNTSTGEISGTPGPADIAVTSGVELSADDGFHVVASNAFDLEVTGAATQLSFGTAPAASEQQDEPWTTFTVRAEDSGGNLVGTWSTPVTLTLATGTGALSGTLSRTPVDGIATFSGISYDTAEAITIDLNSSGLTGILGTALTITAAPSTKLTFASQPSDVEYEDVAFAYIVVEVQDAAGNRITGDNTTQIDLALGVGTGTLSGTLSKVVTAGRAIFADLAYSKVETIDLVATSVPATTTRTSESIVVRANPGAGLAPVRASLDTSELEGDAASGAVALSANGRIAAFESVATNLIAGDSNGARDVFVRDRVSGTTERVSVDSLGTESNGDSFAPALSANGRFVAFESVATNLVTGDTNAARDVFVHDRETGVTVRVSVASAGGQATGDSRAASLSGSGLEIAFESLATDLVAGDANAARDVFVHERVTGTTERVSVDTSEAEANGASSAPALSADGDAVAFQSAATNLVAGDGNAVEDIFVRERTAGTTARVSVDSVGAEADGASSAPALSDDGQIVAFASDATDLVAGDANAARDVFVHERGTGTTTRASIDGSGGEGNGASDLPAISGDGDRVVFESAATNLTPDDDEGHADVFLRKRGAGLTTRLSSAAAGGGGDGASRAAALSADGQHAALASLATDLVAGDTNAVEDTFLRPIHTEPTLASVAPTEGSSLGGTSVTVTGSGFLSSSPGTPTVFFAGVAATGVSVSSDAILTCTTPAGAAGATADVVVVTNNGVATLGSGWTYRSAPAVTSVAPTTGVVIGGTAVTITGTGFTSAGFGSNSVTFGGVAATGVATLDDTTITCFTPAGTAGASVDVAVTNGNGTGTLPSGFAYHAAPTVTAVSPTSGHSNGGDAMTITGTGFQANDAGSSAVTFSGVAASSIVVVNDTTITCANPAGTKGAVVDVAVSNDNGSATLSSGFTYNPAPVLASLAPTSGSPLGGTAVTLTGTGFENNSTGVTTVTVDGVAATSVVVVDDTTITCVAPAGVANTTVDVVLTNDNGGSTLVNGFGYNPPPQLTSLAPLAGSSLGGTSVTLTGTGLQNVSIGTTTVTFDGVAATSVDIVNDTTVTCDTPAGAPSTTVDVVLANGNGSDSLTSAFSFYPTPTLASVSPSQGALNGGTTITLSGTGFTANQAGTNTVTIGGNPATDVVTLNNTTLTCVTPAAGSSGAQDIVLANANGAATLVGGHTYNISPTVTGVAPAEGSSLGATTITITGTGFVDNGAGVNTVQLDGVAATNIVVVNDTTITCDTPAGAAGTSVVVSVSNANGQGALVGGFAYHPQPAVTSLAPAAGTPLGATAVTITGTGFLTNDAGTNAVTFDGTPATDVVVVNDTTITCTAPAGPAGVSVDVVVSNDNGTGTLVGGYGYHAEATVTLVAPAVGSSLGGTAVTVTGSGFTANGAGTNTVTFDGVAATSVVAVSDTSITCVAPAGTAGASVTVAVANDNGSGSLSSAFAYHATPTVSGLAPSAGTSLGGSAVTVSGSGFTANGAGTNTVTFEGVDATSVVVVDDTTITCVTPAGTEATNADVVVSNDNGSGSLANGFAYHPAPTLASVAPNAGTSVGGTSVTLIGTGFQANGAGASTVTFDGAAATNVVVANDTTLTCDTPTGAAGTTVDVVVSNANGAGTLAASYAYHPTPAIASVSPNSGSPVGGTKVTVSGTGFVQNDAGTNGVTFDGLAATNVVVIDDNTLTCDAPTGMAGATVDVVVTNDNGAGIGSGLFAYYAGPALTSVAPAVGTPLGGTSITLTGSGFVADGAGTNTVTIDGAAATNVVVVNDLTITCMTPAGTAGLAADVVVSNDNGAATLSQGFAFHPNPAVTVVTPSSGTQSGGTPLTITGSGFTANAAGTTSLTIGGATPGSVVVVNDTTITCTSLAGTPGVSLDVSVSNANGAGTLVGGFSYNLEPTLTAVSPTTGSSLGGATLTLTGTGFQDFAPGTNTVTVGGAPATGVAVVSDTTITCTTPAGTAGATVDVVVSNANGSGTLSSGYSYHVEPTVTAVTPAVGTSLGGTSVTLTGTGFQANGAGTNAVAFGGAAATSVVVVDDTTITCVTPAGTAGAGVDVDVSNDNGAGSLSAGWDYHAAPTVTAVSPAAGTPQGATAVTLTGTGFLANGAGTNAVTFGGAAATSVVVVDDTTITCVTPAGTAGASVDVDVSNDNGAGTLSAGWDYHPAPTVTAVSPAAGTSLGATAVTLTGTGFQANGAGTNAVAFGGAAATSVVVVDDTTITCVTPAGTAGASVDVDVSNDNGAGALSYGYTYHPTPLVTAVDPPAGRFAGGTAVTLTGTGFLDNGAGTNTVTFGGVAATNVVAVDDATITCDTPAGPPASAVDVVVDNANGSGTLTDGFSYHTDEALDLDDDGIEDLVVGAPGVAGGDGAAYVFLGSNGGLADAGAGAADLTVTAAVTGAALGTAVAVGDLNGDGAPDLALGAPGETAVYVFFGPLTGPTLSTSSADATLDGVGAADDFGAALAIGDLDGDGIDDLVCGAPLRGAGSEGSAYVFLGSTSFAPTSAATADHEFTGAAGDRLGAALSIGDLDASLQPDLALGAPGGERVLVFLGGVGFTGGPASAADATLDGEGAGDTFGAALACGDVSGDGDGDLVVGAPGNDAGGTDAGAAYVFAGVTSFPSLTASSAATKVTGQAAGDGLGLAVATADIDGDGIPELLLGADGWDLDGATTEVGRAYLFFGGTLTLALAASGADARYTGASLTGERFGAALAAADMNDDGRQDLFVAAPEADGAIADTGRVHVFLGTATPTDTTAPADDATFTGAASGDSFGTGLAQGR